MMRKAGDNFTNIYHWAWQVGYLQNAVLLGTKRGFTF